MQIIKTLLGDVKGVLSVKQVQLLFSKLLGVPQEDIGEDHEAVVAFAGLDAEVAVETLFRPRLISPHILRGRVTLASRLTWRVLLQWDDESAGGSVLCLPLSVRGLSRYPPQGTPFCARACMSPPS